MSDLATALRDKISALDDEREELEDSLNRITEKIGLLESLLVDETDEGPPPPAKKRARGRPKGAKNRKTPAKKDTKESNAPKDDLWEQAAGSIPDGSSGSTVEEQQKAIRRFNPAPRVQPNYGVKAGDPKDVLGDQGDKKANVSIEVDDRCLNLKVGTRSGASIVLSFPARFVQLRAPLSQLRSAGCVVSTTSRGNL